MLISFLAFLANAISLLFTKLSSLTEKGFYMLLLDCYSSLKILEREQVNS